MKMYTKTGDKGSTSLYGGQRVTKHDQRIATYGTIDELNATIGTVLAVLPPTLQLPVEVAPALQLIQRDLFTIGAHLATPSATPDPSLPQLRSDGVTWLEHLIDQMDATLPPLRTFILPGGSQAGSYLHVTRTVCRRAERCVVELAQNNYVQPGIIQYLNRLSDFFFVLARSINHALHQSELSWR